MKQRTGLTTWYWLATLALATLFVWAAPAGAQSQSTPPQNNNNNDQMQSQGQGNQPMENRGDHDHIWPAELINMDRFMDSHPEIAEQLRKDPSLLDNKQFVDSHPALQEFLAQHPGVREQARENPNFFMHAEERFDWREDHDITRAELVNMDRFMEAHPEIAEQIRKDPSLLDNKQFVDGHPALRDFLVQHPEIRQEVNDNPNYFMHDEERFARQQDHWGHENGMTQTDLASFHEFLDGHTNVASELSKNPMLATNQEYLENHSELRTYLNTNPQVNQQLSQNPQWFVKSAESFDANSNAMSKGTMQLPATGAKK
jgi:phage-related protein